MPSNGHQNCLDKSLPSFALAVNVKVAYRSISFSKTTIQDVREDKVHFLKKLKTININVVNLDCQAFFASGLDPSAFKILEQLNFRSRLVLNSKCQNRKKENSERATAVSNISNILIAVF